MNLRVDQHNDGEFEISWNPRSPLTKDAILGQLWITDNRRQLRSIDLSSDELQSGRIFYMPASADVSIHLKITNKAGRETSEWIRLRSEAGKYKQVQEGYELGIASVKGSTLKNE